jgi:hypothetical protein
LKRRAVSFTTAKASGKNFVQYVFNLFITVAFQLVHFLVHGVFAGQVVEREGFGTRFGFCNGSIRIFQVLHNALAELRRFTPQLVMAYGL